MKDKEKLEFITLASKNIIISYLVWQIADSIEHVSECCVFLTPSQFKSKDLLGWVHFYPNTF